MLLLYFWFRWHPQKALRITHAAWLPLIQKSTFVKPSAREFTLWATEERDRKRKVKQRWEKGLGAATVTPWKIKGG